MVFGGLRPGTYTPQGAMDMFTSSDMTSQTSTAGSPSYYSQQGVYCDDAQSYNSQLF
eukprot:gnl/Chilomastix_caulleri/3093.p2 GENE.gnl/Chilomastix_caulleri/3093~~gnl/Chilomastix_caulleri/3093.p2  ORF type:complete len:57 (+),score=3.09 gnl/Chilomastix_caulleri/3093:309-479(+)